MKLCLLLSFTLIVNFVFSQSQVKYKLENTDGYFYAYATPSNPKGMLILLPDFNQTEEDLLKKTKIPEMAYIHGVVTIIVPCGKKVFADREMVKTLTEVARRSIEAYEIPENKVILGGYGAGGTIALKYAEYCLKYEQDYPITPSAVYAIESQVDVIEAYRALENKIAKNLDPKAVVEARIAKTIMDNTLGGGPESDLFMYGAISPFNRMDEKNENIKLLKHTPIRLYNDTDILWHLTENQTSVYEMPIASASDMVSRLQLMGNNQAELIKTDVDVSKIRERDINTRTSIDEKDLMIWILSHLKID
ncbi:MAG: hypothetical protein JXR03_13895 [Cyclobacteriaceae bacterium]